MTPKEWALLAQSAYTTTPDLGQENAAGRVVFNHTPDGLILSIPGTNNGQCVLADINVMPLNTGQFGSVHKGIWNAFDQVWLDVSQLPVYALVGHSEGAAGAIFLAARLCSIGKAPKEVWAFEPPRTSIDGTLADVLKRANVDLKIMWHGNDVVPTWPISLPFMDWQHAGEVTKFGTASTGYPNIEDHLMANIVADL